MVLLLPALSGRSMADDLVGKASVIDGDSLEIDATRIRLWGVDAPENDQLCRADDGIQYPCGARSATELANFIAGRPINCVPVSLDQSGRHLQYALWMASTSGTGSSGTGSRWIGRNIRKANMTERNETLIMLDVGSGKEAT